MISPTGIIPDALIDPARKAEMLDWLVQQPMTRAYKLQLLSGWRIWTRGAITSRESARVAASGVDVR